MHLQSRRGFGASKRWSDVKEYRKKQEIQVKNRRQYIRRCQDNATNIPSTPSSKSQLITSIIESATPTTAEKLSEVKLFKLRDRDA